MTMPSRPSQAISKGDERGGSIVRVIETRPGRVVFTEDGNANGWIATDCVLELDSLSR